MPRQLTSFPSEATDEVAPHWALPPPVRRYLHLALPPEFPDAAKGEVAGRIAQARIAQQGQFRTGGPDSPWLAMTAAEHFTLAPPGFVWDATIHLNALLAVRVRDIYCAGSGTLRAAVAGVIPVAAGCNRPGLNSAALQRYLAEAVWFPPALLPGPNLTWSPIDDDTARATLRDGQLVVSLDFKFAADGTITTAQGDRYRDVHGEDVLTPWKCYYGRFVRRHGFFLPLEGRVAWQLPRGPLEYWRGAVTAVHYLFN